MQSKNLKQRQNDATGIDYYLVPLPFSSLSAVAKQMSILQI